MANVFSQAKDLWKLQQEARKMQSQMKEVKVSATSRDNTIEVQINGLNELVSIQIKDELLSPSKKQILVKNLMESLKEAGKKLQKEMAKDLDLNKVKSMLGV